MMFKTVFFSGFLFATVCTSMEIGHPVATLEVMPNFDHGLTYKDFRVHYSGASETFREKSVAIKIYKKGEYATPFHTFTIGQSEVTTPKAYYFGLNKATGGEEYEVEVCADSDCSDKKSALTSMQTDHQTKKIICEKGDEDTGKKWSKTEDIELDIIGVGESDWITKTGITNLETVINQINTESTFQSEMNKYSIQSNPGYVKSEQRVYAGVMFNIAYYRDLFMRKGVPGASAPYAHPFCKRKYLLSYHVHILEKTTQEVIHRFKKTLYMSQGGKQYFVYTNTGTGTARRDVPIELTADGINLDQNQGKQYQVWISFCATEKDKNDSTVCSNPLVKDLAFDD